MVNLDASMRSVDPQVYPAQYAAYREKVAKFLDELAVHWKEGTIMPAFTAVLRIMLGWLNAGDVWTLGEMDEVSRCLMRGFVLCVRERFNATAGRSLRDQLESVRHHLEELNNQNAAAIMNLPSISKNYMDGMLDLFEEKSQLF
jgi:hypothetical protein